MAWAFDCKEITEDKHYEILIKDNIIRKQINCI